MTNRIKEFLKTLSLRTIIMIFCSSFLVLVITSSTIFYFTGTRQVSNMILQNSVQLTSQATQSLDRKFNQIKDSFKYSVTDSYRFLKMSQNIQSDHEPISAKDYTLLAQSLQEFVRQNTPDISTAILMLSNNSIVYTVSDYSGTFRCQQPDYDLLYRSYSNTELQWIYKEDAALFIQSSSAIPEIGLIELLGSETSSLHGLLYIGLSDKALEKELSCYHVTQSSFFTISLNDRLLFYNQTAPDSQDYLITSPMSIQPLSVIAIIPRNEMFLDNDRFSSLLLAEALVAVFLCSILFIAVTKLISAPVEELARQVDSIESLQQLKTVHCTGGKDFLQITAAINHLYARIRQLVASLTQEIQNRKDAELQILHAQINPHFLYNTLDSIGQLCELGETQAASGMVRELSDFYRIGVSKGDTWIPLKEEVLHVTSYLAILQTRFEDFQYQISVPEELEQISVPKIILQPLAENAIYHGIRTMNPGGTISITAKEQNSMLVITVSDDGSGIDEDRLFKIQASLNFETEDTEESLRIYGLKNVHQRIFLSCGSPYGLTIESQLDAGTTVTLCLPLRPCSFSKKEGIC